MADAKISALTDATTPVAGTEVLPIVQSSTTKKVSIADLTAGRAVSAASFIPSSSTIPTNGMYLSGTNTVAWATNSSYRMSVGSGGLSINTTTSNAQITVASSNTGTGTPVSGNSTLWLMNDAGAVTANNGPAITFNARSRTGPTEIQVMAGIKGAKLDANNDEIAGYLAFYTSDNSTRTLVERARIDNLGNYVPAVAAKGINFTANSAAAGMTSQLLNWYEEGTFTPTIVGTSTAGTATYGTQTATYTRIGRMVYFALELNWSSGTGTGFLRVGGLPYTCGANNCGVSIGDIENVALTASYTAGAYVAASSTQIVIREFQVGGGSSNPVAYDAAGTLRIGGCYYV